MEHTPGPWYYNKAVFNKDRAFAICRDCGDDEDPREETIAEICDGPTAEADATLIATAPEMLLLLGEAQEGLDVLAMDVVDEFPARSEGATELAMRIRAAIAKAKNL